MSDEPLTKQQAWFAARVVGEWINFVRTQTSYVDGVRQWPNHPDPCHSSLLHRMLIGEKPKPHEEYTKDKSAT